MLSKTWPFGSGTAWFVGILRGSTCPAPAVAVVTGTTISLETVQRQ